MWGRIYGYLEALLLWLWRFFRILWVCRVPALSALGGGLFVVFTPQTLDLFADTGLSAWQWAIFFLLLFGWGWVVHAMARRALQYDDWLCEARQHELSPDRRRELRQEYGFPARWIPRFLGLAVFVAVGAAMYSAQDNLKSAVEGMQEAATASNLITMLMTITLVIAVLYGLLIVYRINIGSGIARRTPSWPQPAPRLLAGKVPLLALLLQPIRHNTQDRVRATTSVERGLAAAWVVVTAIFVIAVIKPAVVADILPRALFLPVLLGAGVLLFGEVAALSHRWETPLLLILVLIGGGLTYASSHYDDVRWTSAPPAKSAVVGDKPEITFAQALARWKRVNHCDKPEQVCPDPIVIAGAGGASRAAFQTATIVGTLIDLGLQQPQIYGNLRNRIFALSTVSGSSVAAVVIRAALTDAAASGTPDTPPCKTSHSGAWFGDAIAKKDKRFDPTRSWRDCFQRVLAGDFLSPVMVGLAYRDNFPIGTLWSDRAVLLEQAFERRYYYVTGRGAAPCDKNVGDGLCRRFGYHPDPAKAKAWLPLLFINGTSVSTGRRILTSDISAGDTSSGNGVLDPFAYDVRELRDSGKPDSSNLATALFLSTAATMSCRFPVISPPGTIRNAQGDVVDRIVDGGYFENDGLATATDLVRALDSEGLHPIVLRIVNEPEKPETILPLRPGLYLPNDKERALFDVYTSIVRGLLATRSGHEDAYAASLSGELKQHGDSPFIEIDVREIDPTKVIPAAACRLERRPAKKAFMNIVSMSWWLSQPVQAYLDGQLCVAKNWTKLNCVLKAKTEAAQSACYKN